jgi:hypothetical protein
MDRPCRSRSGSCPAYAARQDRTWISAIARASSTSARRTLPTSERAAMTMTLLSPAGSRNSLARDRAYPDSR